jgi:hypothetical protein
LKQAGYDEIYRKNTLQRAIRIYDRMVEEERMDGKPIHRPKDWFLEESRDKKRKKRHSWGTKGGCIAPIIIPSTPNSELLHMSREVADRDAMPGLKFKLVERGRDYGQMDATKHQSNSSRRMCQWGLPSLQRREGPAGSQMFSMSFPDNSVHLTGGLCILEKLREICAPGQVNARRTT